MRVVEFNDRGEPVDAQTKQPIAQGKPPQKPSESPSGGAGGVAPAAPAQKAAASSEGIQRTPLSKYQVRPESEFTVRFCIDFSEGRPKIYRENAREKYPEMEAHYATFRMWTYAEELKWRRECLEYDQSARIYQTNTARLDELKLRRLMKSWSFGEYDERLRLLHTDGVLSDESYDIIRGFYPAIIDHIVYRMNEVLENNG